MSDHEFEKQVHQKMQELKLRPADSVWMEVEKSIRHGNRRRRFMWLWMAALFIGVTTSGYMLYHYGWQTDATTNVAQAASKSSSTQKSTGSTNSTFNSTNANKDITAINPAHENLQPTGDNAASATAPQTGSAQPPIAASETTNPTGMANEIPPAPATIESATGNNTVINKNNRSVQKQPATTGDRTIAAATTNNHNNKYSSDKPRYRKKKGTHATTVQPAKPQHLITSAGGIQTPEPGVNAWNSMMPSLLHQADNSIATNKAVIAPFNSQLSALMKPDSLSVSAAKTVSIPRRKASLWHWGVAADAGYSRIAESKLFQLRGLLGQEKYLAEDLSARSPANVAPSGVSGGQQLNFSANTFPVRKASAIQPDFSFSAGVFVQRTLSPRLKISLGLEYAYMSVNTQLGLKFDSVIDVNIGANNSKVVSRFYGTPGYIDTARAGTYANLQTVDQNKVYYSQKQRYKFHYIEIPILLNWQINKGRSFPPIAFEGGVSIGHLIAAEALHFEGVKGVYYEDNSLLNKTQFNFVTGLNVGLFQRSKHPVWIGPNLRYSLNGLVKKDISTGQYLWSTGLSVKMMMGRL